MCVLASCQTATPERPRVGVKATEAAGEGEEDSAPDPFRGRVDYRINLRSPMHKALVKSYRACKAGDGRACYDVATSYFSGLGVEVDFAKGNMLLIDACDKDHLLACSELAKNLANGMGLEQDVQTARSLLRTTCQRGDPQACGNMAMLYGAKESGYGNMFENFALQFDEAAMFDPDASMADFYLDKESKTVSAQLDNNDKYCGARESRGRGLCVKNALRYLFGYGVGKDEGKARDSLRKMCSMDDGEACHYYANNFSEGDDFVRILNRSCEEGFVRSCSDVVLYSTLNNKDLTHAERACEDGTALWCQYAAHAKWKAITQEVRLERERNLERERRSPEGVEPAPEPVSQSTLEAIVRDRDKAIGMYERGCELNDAYSCSALVSIFGKGIFVKKNEALEKRYRERASSLYPAVNPYATMNRFME